MTKLNTVNVIEIIGGVLNNIRSFSDDTEGNKEAELLFQSIALENGAKEIDLSVHLDDGTFTKGDYELILAHSVI